MKFETTHTTALAFILSLLMLASCSPQELPPGAEQALLDYWASMPSSGEVENEITRAWEGDTSAAELPPGTEVWCVDAEVSAADPVVDGETLRWIVVRTGEDAPWTASLLMAMSSTWPYEACGE